MKTRFHLTLVLMISTFLLEPVFSAETAPLHCPVFGAGKQVGELEHPAITEASGMAASRLRSDLLWIINDSGNGSYLYAAGPTGKHLGRIMIRNAPNLDWEDLCAFRWRDKAYLLVADFGDNGAKRRYCWIYVLPEPTIGAANRVEDQIVDWQWRIQFSYADGPRDSESVAVDTLRQKILIITKRQWPPQLYALPLDPQGKESVYMAQRLAAIPHIPRPTFEDIRKNPIFGRYFSQPTSLDLSPDGRWAVILCYKNAYLFKVEPGADWKAVFRQVPWPIELPRFRQAEALSFSADNAFLYVTSERRPAPLWRLKRNPKCP